MAPLLAASYWELTGTASLFSLNALQWWLAGSNHPYAPFVGNALKWQSYAYDDGTT